MSSLVAVSKTEKCTQGGTKKRVQSFGYKSIIKPVTTTQTDENLAVRDDTHTTARTPREYDPHPFPQISEMLAHKGIPGDAIACSRPLIAGAYKTRGDSASRIDMEA